MTDGHDRRDKQNMKAGWLFTLVLVPLGLNTLFWKPTTLSPSLKGNFRHSSPLQVKPIFQIASRLFNLDSGPCVSKTPSTHFLNYVVPLKINYVDNRCFCAFSANELQNRPLCLSGRLSSVWVILFVFKSVVFCLLGSSSVQYMMSMSDKAI